MFDELKAQIRDRYLTMLLDRLGESMFAEHCIATS